MNFKFLSLIIAFILIVLIIIQNSHKNIPDYQSRPYTLLCLNDYLSTEQINILNKYLEHTLEKKLQTKLNGHLISLSLKSFKGYTNNLWLQLIPSNTFQFSNLSTDNFQANNSLSLKQMPFFYTNFTHLTNVLIEKHFTFGNYIIQLHQAPFLFIEIPPPQLV